MLSQQEFEGPGIGEMGRRSHALFAFPVVLIAMMFVTGLGLVLSAGQVRFRDIGLAMPLVL